MPNKVDFDRLLDPETPPDHWRAEMESGATGEDEKPCDRPVCAPLEFDREHARVATADDGIDYGLLSSSDAAWWVWRTGVDQTQHFKIVIEQLEPSMTVLEELEDHERQRIFMERMSELVSRDPDTIRALECGLLTSNDVLTEAMRRIIALHPQEEMEELKKILQEQDS